MNQFVVTLSVGLIGAPGSTRSQGRKTARIGWVGGWYCPAAAQPLFDAFRQRMRELGYVEGQNLAIDALSDRTVGDRRGSRLIAQLVRSQVDVLVLHGAAIFGAKASPEAG